MAERVNVANPLHDANDDEAGKFLRTLVKIKQNSARLRKKIVRTASDRAIAQVEKIQRFRSGKAELTDTISMAISASQMFQLAVLAAAQKLPQLFLDLAKKFNFALFSFKVLEIPSINVDVAEWAQSVVVIPLIFLCAWFVVYAVPSGWQLVEDNTHDGDEAAAVSKRLKLLPWQQMIKPAEKSEKRHNIFVSACFGVLLVVVVLIQALMDSLMSEVVFTLVVFSSFAVVVATMVKWALQWLLEYQFTNAMAIHNSPMIHNKPGEKWDPLMPDKFFWVSTTYSFVKLSIVFLDAVFVPLLVLALDGLCQTDSPVEADSTPPLNATIISNHTRSELAHLGKCKLGQLDMATMLLAVLVLLPTCAGIVWVNVMCSKRAMAMFEILVAEEDKGLHASYKSNGNRHVLFKHNERTGLMDLYVDVLENRAPRVSSITAVRMTQSGLDHSFVVRGKNAEGETEETCRDLESVELTPNMRGLIARVFANSAKAVVAANKKRKAAGRAGKGGRKQSRASLVDSDALAAPVANPMSAADTSAADASASDADTEADAESSTRASAADGATGGPTGGALGDALEDAEDAAEWRAAMLRSLLGDSGGDGDGLDLSFDFDNNGKPLLERHTLVPQVLARTPADAVKKYRGAHVVVREQTYFPDGDVKMCKTVAHVDLAADAACAETAIPFIGLSRHCWWLPLLFLLEKAGMVTVVQVIPETDDLVLMLPVAIGGFMLVLSFFAYEQGAKRNLALVARASSIAVSSMGLLKHQVPDMDENIMNVVMLIAFFSAFGYYLLHVNPYAIVHKVWVMLHLPSRVEKVLGYDLPTKLSEETGWLSEYKFDKFEPLVLSISQIEYILSHKWTDERCDAWLKFAAEERPSLGIVQKIILPNRGVKAIGPSVKYMVGVEDLNLNSNADLSELPDSIFSLPNVKQLSAEGCDLPFLPDDMHKWAGTMTSLILSNNKRLRSLGGVRAFRQLVYLNCDSCAFVELPELPPSLRSLRLYGNQLTSLECASGAGLPPRLRFLNVERNKLEEIGPVVRLTDLEELVLGSNSMVGNPLRVLPEGIGELSKLKRLRANGCQFSALPDSLGRCTRLELLEFNQGSDKYSLTSLPKSLSRLHNLTKLNIGGNAELGDEAIEIICKPSSTPKMMFLDIWECGLTALPDWMDECTSLNQLNLRSNKLEGVADERKLRLEEKLSATWERDGEVLPCDINWGSFEPKRGGEGAEDQAADDPLAQLTAMGFPEDAAEAALAQAGGDVMAAMEKLFG